MQLFELVGELARLAMWSYATTRPRLLFVAIDARARTVGVLAALVPGVGYAVGIAVADRSPTLSISIYAAVPILYIALVTLARGASPPDSADQQFT